MFQTLLLKKTKLIYANINFATDMCTVAWPLLILSVIIKL